MAIVFEATDPRGIRIYCEGSQWEQHIIIDSNHPVMAENIEAIKETIISPQTIHESHDSDPPMNYRVIYCREVPTATYYNQSAPLTKVVVCISGGTGEVITAYPAKNAKGGTKGEPIYCDGKNKI